MIHCKDWQERIALHAGGDLEAREAALVEEHLAGCRECQVFWSGMKESLELLRGGHAEALAPASYTAVRSHVLANLQADLLAGRRAWWRTAWARRGWWPAALAAAVLILLALTNWPRKPVQSPGEPPVRSERLAVAVPPQTTAVPSEPAAPRPSRPALVPVRSQPVRRARHAGKATVRPVQPPRQPLLVRLVTDDPDVVIYWIAD